MQTPNQNAQVSMALSLTLLLAAPLGLAEVVFANRIVIV